MTNREWSVCALRARVGDRSDVAMGATGPLAAMIGARLDIEVSVIGRPENASRDGWQQALANARPVLDELFAYSRTMAEMARRSVFVLPKCSAAIATLPPFIDRYRDIALYWFDAHGDFNTPSTTSSRYIGGMALSGVCGAWDTGYGPSLTSDRVVLIGCRDLEAAETRLLLESRVELVSTKEYRKGMFRPRDTEYALIHLDCDAFDPSFVASELYVSDGLLPYEIREAITEISRVSHVVAVNVTEFECPCESDLFAAQSKIVLDAIDAVFN